MLQISHKKLIARFYFDVNSLGLRFPNADIVRKTGYNKATVSKFLNKKETPSLNFIETFYEKFTQLENPFKIASVGEPIEPYHVGRRNQKLQPKRKEIPFFDAEAEAGILTDTEMTPIHAPSGTIDVGDLLSDSESAMRIYGNSMTSNYPPGCVVGLIPYLDASIEPGEVYVIETKSSRRLKRLFFKDDDPDSEYIMCYSDNTMKFTNGAREGKLAYPPYYIHRSEILRLFAVSGVIKRNMNSVIINR